MATFIFAVIGVSATVLAWRGGGLNMPPVVLWWIAVWMLLFAMVAGWMFRQSLRPGNWLLAITGDCWYLNARSYLNHGLPGEAPVVELKRREIMGVRRERVHIDKDGETVYRTRLVIALQDRSGFEGLARVLEDERVIRPKTIRAVDYPVEVLPGPTAEIGLWWDAVTPAATIVVERLAPGLRH